MKVIIKKNYFWRKKIKTWEYLSNRKGPQRDLGVLIILRSRLKVWESDSRFSLWLTESILSSCNSSGPLYLQDFRSWKQCWGKTYTQPPSLTIMCSFFSFCKHNIITKKTRWWKGAGPGGSRENTKARPNSGNSGRFQVNSQISIWFLFLDFNMTCCECVISAYHLQRSL